MKVKIFWLLVFCVTLCSGCIKSSNKMVGAIPQIKVGLMLYTKEDTFISSIVSSFEKVARNTELSKNIKIVVNVFDGKGSQTAQNEQIDKCMEQNYDVLCINLVDRTAAASVIDRAKARDIPLVFFNREPVKEDLERWDKVYYVGTDAKMAGILQGNMIVNSYIKDPASVDKNGDGRLQYVMLEGEQVHQDTLLRTEYAVKTVVGAKICVEKLANETANWQRSQGMSKTVQWIRNYGEKIEVVFSNNDDMALGAIDAYHAAGITKMPFIVGVDCTALAVEELRKGTLQGTVFGDFKGQAGAMLTLCLILAAEEVPPKELGLEGGKYIMLQNTAVTIDNLFRIDYQ